MPLRPEGLCGGVGRKLFFVFFLGGAEVIF